MNENEKNLKLENSKDFVVYKEIQKNVLTTMKHHLAQGGVGGAIPPTGEELESKQKMALEQIEQLHLVEKGKIQKNSLLQVSHFAVESAYKLKNFIRL